MKKVFSVLLSLLLLMGLTACNEEKTPDPLPNDPYVYEEKSSHTMGEQMLIYLQTKYKGKSFIVSDFYNGGIIDSPYMTAYDSEMTEEDTFTVTMDTETNKFTDDYAWFFVGPVYSTYIRDFAETSFGTGNVKAINNTGYTDISNVDTITTEEIKGHCSSRGFLFIYGEYSTEEIEAYAKEILAPWMIENGFETGPRIIVVHDREIFNGIDSDTDLNEILTNDDVKTADVMLTVTDNNVSVLSQKQHKEEAS